MGYIITSKPWRLIKLELELGEDGESFLFEGSLQDVSERLGIPVRTVSRWRKLVITLGNVLDGVILT